MSEESTGEAIFTFVFGLLFYAVGVVAATLLVMATIGFAQSPARVAGWIRSLF